VPQERGSPGPVYRVRVALVDDHAILRQSLRLLLQSRDVVEVVGEYENGRRAVDEIPRLRPDIVLMDVAMPHLNGIEATRLIKRESADLRVIMLSSYVDIDHVRESLRAGASGYILKRSDIGELILAIQTVHMGNTYFSKAVGEQFDMSELMHEAKGHTDQRSGLEHLTVREREVLQLIVEGYTTKQIAGELFISPKTVEGHKTRVMDKLQSRNRTDLLRFALHSGISTDEDQSPREMPAGG
jgi:DNA-binding NarL/FixJ family response regulator